MSWLNWMCEFTAQQETVTIKLREKLHLRRTVLAAALFHNPAEGMEMYEQMMASLADETDEDDAWLLEEDAKTSPTDLQAIEHLVKKRAEVMHHERSNTSESPGPDSEGRD